MSLIFVKTQKTKSLKGLHVLNLYLKEKKVMKSFRNASALRVYF